MTQSIDPLRLKAAAEHLEWVLQQYPENADVQGLLRALMPLINAAKARVLKDPMDRLEIPCAYNFSDGVYTPFKDPNVEDAYVAFSIELRGGLSEQERELHDRIRRMREQAQTGAVE